jgi:tRNA (guanine26-N2/guanine27-N2)-dimethyltransferase
MEVTEGDVTVAVPDDDSVFFNPVQELNRDVTVAALRAYRERADRSPETYLDAMAASGVRGVRAAAEGWDVTLCDVDPEAVDLARENLARNDLDGEAVRRKASAYMHETHFDIVDIDPFGTPIPFADAAFNCATDLVCVTATDTAPLCGAHFESGVRTYSAVPRNTEFHAEMGVRVLLSVLARTAARYDVAVTPLLTHATNHYVRTYLALEGGATPANAAVEELGHVDWCRECLYREASHGLIADPLAECPNCGADVATAGPLWLAPAHDADFVRAVRGAVTDDMGTADRARKLLGRIAGELHTPTHYDQHRLHESWGQPAVGMDEFLDTLREAGYEASRTHYGGTTLKTTADVPAMADLFEGA